MKDLVKGKRIVVTGSSSGIGLETARFLSEQGAEVLGVDMTKNFDYVEEFYRADLSDPRTIDVLLDVLPNDIDGLVNNAGVPPTKDANILLRVNLIGLKRLTYGLIPKLADGASIVNVASLAGHDWPNSVDAIKAADDLDFGNLDAFIARWKVSSEGGRSYFFAKEALIAWTLRNRWTWRNRGIRMNSVSPGPVDTPILGDFLQTLGARAEEDRKIMDRPGTPQDIAPVIAFLLSDMTTWIRGTNIPTDGGMHSNILCSMHGL
ncbi:coniferyl-alcohol dehydrogenase [Boseongicola aestuarii]|uniref:3-alpha-hydroxysteroid dehydrogenase/carbonyl reductase n=1 Tax=Boseongicola aestuarii TaxID=1470561 RepID=A0A238J1C6_9RHOB|nr:coniferyl-alcohol dehydrogenase [Boseongicola aestuarii]SMX23975.1 3-alpha-hydroxysteroid dehydrogenase/carbonyl reductase [Boseongicola aestuarii]